MEDNLFDLENIEFINPSETSSVENILEDIKSTEPEPVDEPIENEPFINLDEDVEEDDDEDIDDEPKPEKVKKGKPKPEPKPKETDSDESTFTVLAKALVEEGVLSELPEDFAGDAASLLNVFRNEQLNGAKNIFDNFLQNLPPKLKKAVSSYAEGLDEDSSFELGETYEKYSTLTYDRLESDVTLQKQVYKEALLRKGFSEEKADKYVKRAEDNDDLLDESYEALDEQKDFYEKEEVRKKSELREREQRIIEEQRRQLEAIKTDIESTEEIVPGLKLNKKLQESLFKSMTEIVGKDDYGNPLNSVMKTRSKNPVAFEKAVHYYHMLGLFNIDEKGNFKPDTSKIVAVSKTKALSELERKIKTEPLKGGNSAELDEDSDVLSAFESFFKGQKNK